MLTIGGRMIDYQEAGEGPVVLFLPGSFSTPTAWRGVQRHLPQRYRLVATSLCGYGKTDESRTPNDFGIEHQVRIVEAVARHTGSPVHLVGHSWGATVALATALAANIEVLSIATFEANPPGLLHERGHAEMYKAMTQMSFAVATAHSLGERNAAKGVIDFWGGDGVFDSMPAQVQDYCRSTTAANILDWRSYFQFEAGASEFGGLNVPVLLVRGGCANPAMVEITNGLSASLPAARTAIVDGANHFLITSHQQECASLLAEFLTEVAGNNSRG